MTELDPYLKENAIRLAELHRETCDGQDCPVSLFMIGRLIKQAGFELTEEEQGRLL